MGCTTSKPVTESPDHVLRICKDRQLHIEDAIKYRKRFAAVHAAYIHSLKNVGSALRRFAGEEFSTDMDESSQPSSTPILALPPPSTSSLGDLSPPRQSALTAPTLSPPHSPSRESTFLHVTLPPRISVSPPLSPMRLPTNNNHSSPVPPTSNHSISPLESPSSSPHNTSPSIKTAATSLRSHSLDSRIVSLRTHSLNNMVSPDRGSEFSPPYYSPSRDDLDEALVAYSPSPPFSLIMDSEWFDGETFSSPPHHLQEHRRLTRASSLDHKDVHGASKVEELEEDIPDLEESDHKENETVDDERDTTLPTNKDPNLGAGEDSNLKDAIPDEIEKRVVLEETVDNSGLKVNEAEVIDDNLEEVTSNALSIPRKPVVSETLVGSEVTKHDQGSAVVLKQKSLPAAMQCIDELCARANQCGRDVSLTLETQMHFQSKADGKKDSTKVFNAITSHWSRKAPYILMEDADEDDVLECGMSGSHASTLERLYAWERKLYHEVKEGRLLRTAFDKKFKELHILNAKGGDQTHRDKLKANIKKLDTRLLVAIRAISAASLRIQQLSMEELYPQLCELLRGLTSMWRMMAECHRAQSAIAFELQTFESLGIEMEASELHKKATAKLKRELEKLQTHFQGWIWSQKKYISELDEWIKRCYEIRDLSEEPTTNSKKTVSDQSEKVPVFQLLRAWRSSIFGLSSDHYVNGIRSFMAAMRALEEDQFNELKSKRQAEKSSKRLGQQTVFLDKLEREYKENKSATFTFSPARLLRLPSARKIPEKRAHLDKYKSKVEMETHEYFEAAQVRKNTTADLLQQQLPSFFQSLSKFAEDAQRMYEKVKEMAEDGDSNLGETVGVHAACSREL